MANYRYFIEPTSYDRGLTKATSHVGEWNSVLIDLGELSNGRHQCYSLVDGHVEAQKEYFDECVECSHENYVQIVGNHLGNIPEQYLIKGDIQAFTVDVLGPGEAPYVIVWDKLPASVERDTDEPFKIIVHEEVIELLATALNFETVEMMETVLGHGNVHAISKDLMNKVGGALL